MAQQYNLGKVALTPKGTFNANVTYEHLDIVTLNGSSYLVLQSCKGITPPNATYYQLIASKGNAGTNGVNPTVTAGTATMLPVGSAPTVTNSGTAQTAIFDFGIPYPSLADSEVTTAKLADGAVTPDKLEEDYALAEDVSNTRSITSVRRATFTQVDGKYVAKNGTISTNASYFYIEIDVNEGDVIPIFRSYYNGSTSVVPAPARFICAYVNGTAVSSKGADNATSYTVPEGVTKIACSFTTTYPVADYVPIFSTKNVTFVKSDSKIESVAFASYPQKIVGDLEASSTLTMKANSVKKNAVISFYGKIGSIGTLTIGKGSRGATNGEYITVDGTNLKIYRQSSAAVVQAHGLTFADYIYICLSIGQDHKPKISIMTNGGSYEYTDTGIWAGDDPNLYVESDASTTLTDCALSWICRDIDKPLWIFGDSYVSFTSDRWTYYAHALGFDEYLINGFSGARSWDALNDLYNLLTYGKPRYVLWALGMNDKDSSTAVNKLWDSVFSEVSAICDEIGATLIPCTIPNVPSVENTFKNAIVEASGLTYIDFATAVGAHDDTTWYSGMLSSDNLHPSVEGAKALFAEAMKDFPYIVAK